MKIRLFENIENFNAFIQIRIEFKNLKFHEKNALLS